jgi:tape measure domain-containing protein
MAESYTVQAVLSAVDKNMSSTFSKALGSAESFSKKCGSIAKGVLVGNLGSKAVTGVADLLSSSLSGAINRFDTLQSYPRVMNSLGFATEQSQASVAKLNKSVQGLPTSLADVVTTAKSLASVSGNIDKATNTTIALNHAFLASGSSSADASRGLQQYSQMLAKGTVDLQSWRTLQETMAPALTKVAKKLGIASGSANDLYDALQNGVISFDDFNNAMIECDTETGGFADTALEASKGVKTSMTNIKSAVENLEMGFMSAMNNMMKSKAMDGIVDNLEKVKSKIYDFRNAIMESKDDGLTWNFKPEVLQKVSQAMDWLGERALDAKDMVKSFLNAFLETRVIQNGIDMFNNLKDAITNVMHSLAKSDVFASLGNTFGQLVGQIELTISNVAKFIAGLKPKTVQTMAKAVKDLALTFAAFKIGKSVASQIKGVSDSLKKVKNTYEDLKNLRKGIKGSKADSDTSTEAPTFKETQKSASTAADNIKTIFDGLAKNLQTIFDGISNVGKTVFNGLANNIKAVFSGVSNVLKTVFTGLGTVIKQLGTSINTAAKGIGTGLKTALEGVSKAVESAGKGISTAAQGIGKGIKSALSGVPKVLESAGKGISTAAQGIGKGLSTAVQGLGTAVSTVAQGIGQGLSTALTGLGAALAMVPPTTWLAIGAAALMMGASIALVASQADGCVAILGALGGVLETTFNGLCDVIVAVTPVILASINSMVTMFQTIPDILNGLANVISSTFTSIASFITACCTGIADVVTSTFTGIADVVSSVLTGVAGIVSSAFNGIATVITSVGNAIKGVLEGVAGVIDSIGVAALNAGKGFDKLASGVVKITNTDFKDMAASLTAVAAGCAAIGKSASGLATAGEGMQDLSTAMSSIGTSAPTAATAMASIGTACTTISGQLSSLPAAFITLTAAMTAFNAQSLAMSTGMLVMVAGCAVVNAQITAMSASMSLLSTAVTTASTATTMLSTSLSMVSSMIVMATTGMMTLSTCAMTVMTGLAGISTSAMSATAGLTSIAAAALMVCASLAMVGPAAFAAMAGFSGAIATGAAMAASTMSAGCASIVSAVQSGLSILPGIASSAMSAFTGALASGGSAAISTASSIMSSIYSVMSAGTGRAYSCGLMIGMGLANGLRAATGAVQAAAAALAAAADAAIQAKAKIGSPSRVQYQNGLWFGQGLANGIEAMSNKVWDVAENLVDIPRLACEGLDMELSAFDAELNDAFNYEAQVEYTIYVPLEIDGRELAKAQVTNNQRELARAQKFKQKLGGVK